MRPNIFAFPSLRISREKPPPVSTHGRVYRRARELDAKSLQAANTGKAAFPLWWRSGPSRRACSRESRLALRDMKFGTFGDSECPPAETATFKGEQVPGRGDGSGFQGARCLCFRSERSDPSYARLQAMPGHGKCSKVTLEEQFDLRCRENHQKERLQSVPR